MDALGILIVVAIVWLTLQIVNGLPGPDRPTLRNVVYVILVVVVVLVVLSITGHSPFPGRLR